MATNKPIQVVDANGHSVVTQDYPAAVTSKSIGDFLAVQPLGDHGSAGANIGMTVPNVAANITIPRHGKPSYEVTALQQGLGSIGGTYDANTKAYSGNASIMPTKDITVAANYGTNGYGANIGVKKGKFSANVGALISKYASKPSYSANLNYSF